MSDDAEVATIREVPVVLSFEVTGDCDHAIDSVLRHLVGRSVAGVGRSGHYFAEVVDVERVPENGSSGGTP